MTTAIQITARLKSTRLPLKVIKSIHGKPMISHLLDRLRLVKSADFIVICTSPAPQDDPLVTLAEQEGVRAFRGDGVDVLKRMRDAAQLFEVDTIISCTADNPFVDPAYIDRLVAFHTANHHDFSKTEGLPFGTFAYALQRTAVEKACEIKDEADTEVWGGYFTQTNLFSVGTYSDIDADVNEPNLRLTVDTPEDFELINRIFDALYQDKRVFSLPEIVQFMRQNPHLQAINAQVQQKPGIPIRLKTLE